MPSLSLIMTSAGRAAVLGGSASVIDVQLSSANQSVTADTTALSAVVATVQASGSVRPAGSSYSLHIVVRDESAAAYDVRSLAVRIAGGAFLLVYSQAALVASKAAGSSLHIAFDLTIDGQTASAINFGSTDYLLPHASSVTEGMVQVATPAEVWAFVDSTRSIAPDSLHARVDAAMRQAVELATLPTLANRASILSVSDADSDANMIVVVAAASNNQIYTSSDGGETFQLRSTGGSPVQFRAVLCAATGLKVAVGSNGAIFSSLDGVTWSQRYQNGSAGYFDAVAYAVHGGYCAVGDWIATSPSGIPWTLRAKPAGFTGRFRDVCALPGSGFVAVGDGGQIATSVDGATWVTRPSGTSANLQRVQSTPAGLIAMGASAALGSGFALYSADDGATWESLYATDAGPFCAVSPSGLITAPSLTGYGWTVRPYVRDPNGGAMAMPLVNENARLKRAGACWIGWTTAGDVYVSKPISVK